MSEPMSVVVEAWPLAADEQGIWLVSGLRPWCTDQVPSDSEPHFELMTTLRENLPGVPIDLVHSTSWRVDGPHVILTYVAVVHPQTDFVIGDWPAAKPVSSEMHQFAGRPIPHSATEPPTPRDWDVLMHAVRHLRFLKDTDQTVRAAMSEAMLESLSGWEPVLSGLYSEYYRHSA
jgi:hypothetical protein